MLHGSWLWVKRVAVFGVAFGSFAVRMFIGSGFKDDMRQGLCAYLR